MGHARLPSTTVEHVQAHKQPLEQQLQSLLHSSTFRWQVVPSPESLMASCRTCGKKIGFLDAIGVTEPLCVDCRRAVTERAEAEMRAAAVLSEAARQAAEQHAAEMRMRQREAGFQKLLQHCQESIASGQRAFVHDSIYLPVNSIVQDTTFGGFDIGELQVRGLSGWEIVGVVPRTLGIDLKNSYVGDITSTTQYAGGIGGNVIGVHVILRREVTSGMLEADLEWLRTWLDGNEGIVSHLGIRG